MPANTVRKHTKTAKKQDSDGQKASRLYTVPAERSSAANRVRSTQAKLRSAHWFRPILIRANESLQVTYVAQMSHFVIILRSQSFYQGLVNVVQAIKRHVFAQELSGNNVSLRRTDGSSTTQVEVRRLALDCSGLGCSGR